MLNKWVYKCISLSIKSDLQNEKPFYCHNSVCLHQKKGNLTKIIDMLGFISNMTDLVIKACYIIALLS